MNQFIKSRGCVGERAAQEGRRMGVGGPLEETPVPKASCGGPGPRQNEHNLSLRPPWGGGPLPPQKAIKIAWRVSFGRKAPLQGELPSEAEGQWLVACPSWHLIQAL